MAPASRTPAAHLTLSRQIAAAAREAIQTGALEPLLAHGQQLAGMAAAGPMADRGPEQRSRLLDARAWRRDCGVQPALGAAPAGPDAALHALAGRASLLADEMRFDFLYDRRRRIFTIGYRLADADGPGRADASFYDLLASEARLASFVAIAKGDVPQHHWFHLGRLVTNVDGRATLMSWGGTMFEYLMPLLLMRSFPGTLLDQSCRASVRARSSTAGGATCRGGSRSRRIRSPIARAPISTRRSACRGWG